MTAAEAAGIATAVQAAPVLDPFSKDAMACCSALSRALLRDPQARRYPDLMALGFWLREAQLSALQAEFRALETPVHRLFPRGTIFQIAPANVDTLFAYMWSLALLTGNRSIVRLSSRSSPQAELLLDTIGRILAGYSRVAEGNRFARYSHDAELTAQFSLACDLRVVWGGDETVNTVRRLPLPPHARDLVFPDRYSFCAIKAPAYLAANTAGRSRLARDFCNDVLWFDQMACSSPRTVLWCGEECDCESAADDFLQRASAEAERRAPRDGGAAVRMQKFLFACRMACDGQAVGYDRASDGITVLRLRDLSELPREHCGGGLFWQHHLRSLQDFAPSVERKDQTLTWFGFTPQELGDFAAAVNGRGIDRMVPIGQALQFSRFWDGYDLLQEFSRRVVWQSPGCAR